MGIDTTDVAAVPAGVAAWEPRVSAGERRTLAVQRRTSAGERRVSAVQRKFSAGELHARAMGSGRRYTSSTLRSASVARWFAYAAYAQPRLAPGKRPQASIEIEERGIRIVVDRQLVAREHRHILRNGLISHDLTKHSRILRL